MASRHAAAGTAGLAQGNRDPRSGQPPGDRSAAIPHDGSEAVRRRHRTRWRPAPQRNRAGGVRPAPGIGDLFQAGRQTSAGSRGFRCWRCSLATPGQDWSAACIGRPKRGTTPRVEEIGRPDGDAVEVLRELVAIYDAGRREPLPLPVKTSYAWAVARHAGDDPEKAAGYRWRSGLYPGEDAVAGPCAGLGQRRAAVRPDDTAAAG